jgi:hypothetical protein
MAPCFFVMAVSMIYFQPKTGKEDAVPQHNEINEIVAKSIIKNLSSP